MNFQHSLANYSFLTLLMSMIFYWVGFGLKSLPLTQSSKTGLNTAPLVNSPLHENYFVNTSKFEKFSFLNSSTPVSPLPFGEGATALRGRNFQNFKSQLFFHIKTEKFLNKNLFVKKKKMYDNSESSIFLHLFKKKSKYSTGVFGFDLVKTSLINILSFFWKLTFILNPVNLAKYGIIISNLLLTVLLMLRWKESGHFPLSNLYESLMFLSWCFTAIHIFFEISNFDNFLSWLPQPPEGGQGLTKAKRTLWPPFGLTNKLLSLVQSESFQRSKVTEDFKKSTFKQKELTQLVGAITTPSALLMNAFATFTLPKGMQQITPLVPALQSNWLIMHVTVMILSYAALIIGSLLSIGFLVITTGKSEKKSTTSILPQSGNSLVKDWEHEAFAQMDNSLLKGQHLRFSLMSGVGVAPPVSPLPFGEGATAEELPEEASGLVKQPFFQENNSAALAAGGRTNILKNKIEFILDNLSYRILGIGFPLLTIGILSGAVWANEAWGSYWSWDPKETWALLTWLVFAIYLHTRLSKGWEGKKPAMIASFGFISVLFTYLGVNLIGEGLHSYGWLS